MVRHVSTIMADVIEGSGTVAYALVVDMTWFNPDSSLVSLIYEHMPTFHKIFTQPCVHTHTNTNSTSHKLTHTNTPVPHADHISAHPLMDPATARTAILISTVSMQNPQRTGRSLHPPPHTPRKH